MARRTMRVNNQPRNPQNEAAWRAVREFSKMLPTLTSFARMMTGNREIVVRLGTEPGASTNGKQIFIAPPIALGAELHHPDRSECGRRGPAKKLICKACAARETVMWYLYHEIGHNVGESTMKLDNFQRAKLESLVDEWHPKGVCSHGGPIKARMAVTPDVLNATSAVSGFLAEILRSLEDSRVDNKMVRMRPGLRNMRRANTLQIFIGGCEQPDGTILHWRDTPLNAQIIIGLLLYAGGNEDCIEFLSPEAQEYLADEKLREIASQAPVADNVNQVLEISVAAWMRMTEMGVCYIPKCEPAPPPPPMPSLDKEKDEDGGESDQPDDADEPDSDDGSGSNDDEDNGDADRSGDSESDGGAGSESSDAGDSDTPEDADESDDNFNDDFENESAHGGSSRKDQEDDAADAAEDDDAVHGDDRDEVQDEQSGTDPDGGTEDGDSNDREDGIGAGDNQVDEPLEGEGSGSNTGSGDAGDGEAGDGSADNQTEPDSEGDLESSDDLGDGDGEPDPGREGPRQGLAPGGGQSTGITGSTGEDRPGEDDAAEEAAEEVYGPEPVGDESVWDEPVPDAGEPEEIADIIRQFGGHTHDGHPDEQDVERMLEEAGLTNQPLAAAEAVKLAVQQSEHFDAPSQAISGVVYVEYPNRDIFWRSDRYSDPADFMPAERIVGRNLMKARIIFSENKRGKEVRNLKSGRVNARVLGKRAHVGDERVFQKRYQPGKRSYFVLIGLDCSGSNQSGHRMERAKRAVFAQAELLNRLGIPFAVYAHTGGMAEWVNWPYDGTYAKMWMLPVKTDKQAWNDEARRRLAAVNPVAENYDGHQLHVYRRMLEKRTETSRILMYYTDGAMPAANYDEELALLQTEIIEYRRKNITLMAVGINTDSPTRYGFDTVRVESDDDLLKVVDQLERRLTE